MSEVPFVRHRGTRAEASVKGVVGSEVGRFVDAVSQLSALRFFVDILAIRNVPLFKRTFNIQIHNLGMKASLKIVD